MKILFCCQFYAPSVGGVQELIRQLSEHLVQRGHEVTVATTALPERKSTHLNGVCIREFSVQGNLVTGLSGETVSYQHFVTTSEFDIMLVYAAQQWTFDALWTVLDDIPYPVIFAPCGFSGLYEQGYADYFRNLAEQLDKFDCFIFNASSYRDVDFILSRGKYKYEVISNAANEKEFNTKADPTFRGKMGVPEESFVFLTVGSLTGMKGHEEIVAAFGRMDLDKHIHSTLILNGNSIHNSGESMRFIHKLLGVFRTYGFIDGCRHVLQKALRNNHSLKNSVERVNVQQKNKQILMTNLDRTHLVQAFFSADLFVFASKIEHSPLVLFESAAAGLPFLSVDVGNAKEIAEWTGAGVICPSEKDKRGYTRVDVNVLAEYMERWMGQSDKRKNMGEVGRKQWSEKFTWEHVSLQYERVFRQVLETNR